MNDGDISPSGWGTLLGCLALGVLLGLALQLYGHAVLRPRLRALLERGERAEATVVERWEEIDDSVRHSVIRYRFAPPAGPVVERAEFVDEHTERCHTGAQVPVYYLPERPNVSMLAPHYQETQRLRL